MSTAPGALPARRILAGHARSAHFAGALATYRRAYQLQAIVLWAVRLLAVGLAVDVATLLASRLIGGFDPPVATLVVPPMLGAIGGALYAAMHRPRIAWLAREIDRRLDLRERTLTALELLEADPARAVAADRFALGGEQIDDTIAHLRRAEPLDAFPVRLPRRAALAAGALALALVPLMLLAPPGPAERVSPRLDQLARGEAERISALADEIERDDEPDATTAAINAQAAQVLRQVAESLREATGDVDRPMARLGDAERRLAGMQSGNAFETSSALGRLADALDRDARTRATANALDRRDYKRAAEEMRATGARAAAGSEADRQAIAEALRRGGAAAARYDEKLAEALRDAAERTQRGDASSTESAARELGRAGAEMRRQESIERAASQLQNSRRTLGTGAPRDASGSQPTRGGRASGQDERSQGERGDGASGAGGQGRGPGERGQGDGTGESGGGDQPGSGAGTGTRAATTNVWDPAVTRSRQVQVPGGDFDRPQISEGEQMTDSAEGEVHVDYRDVLPAYQERATRAMQDRYIPLGMKDLVRDYFTSLQPGNGR